MGGVDSRFRVSPENPTRAVSKQTAAVPPCLQGDVALSLRLKLAPKDLRS